VLTAFGPNFRRVLVRNRIKKGEKVVAQVTGGPIRETSLSHLHYLLHAWCLSPTFRTHSRKHSPEGLEPTTWNTKRSTEFKNLGQKKIKFIKPVSSSKAPLFLKSLS